ncbi:MAG: chromosome partitioning protein ParB, partial [Nitrospira sp.]
MPKRARRRRKTVGATTGLAAGELQAAAPPGAVAKLHQLIEADQGKVLSVYRDPYGGQWLVQAALPIDLLSRHPINEIYPTRTSESWKGS